MVHVLRSTHAPWDPGGPSVGACGGADNAKDAILTTILVCFQTGCVLHHQRAHRVRASPARRKRRRRPRDRRQPTQLAGRDATPRSSVGLAHGVRAGTFGSSSREREPHHLRRPDPTPRRRPRTVTHLSPPRGATGEAFLCAKCSSCTLPDDFAISFATPTPHRWPSLGCGEANTSA